MGSTRRRVIAWLGMLTLASSLVVVAQPATATADEVTAYAASSPLGITAGPDGALWFTEFGVPSIGRITTSGVVTSYSINGISGPGVVAGSDGALWFTYVGSSIGRITTAGVVTDFTGPGISFPYEIAAGPDGALWFTNRNNDSIGRITTGGVVSNFTGVGIDNPNGIDVGSDGALWFTNSDNNSIGRITTGGVVSNFTGTGISQPTGIAAGPDGALWFTNRANGSIGRITTSGVVSNFTGKRVTGPDGITAGPDGALWFVNSGSVKGRPSSSVGRITTAGVVSDFSTADFSPTDFVDLHDITTGSDGALWVTDYRHNSIDRVFFGIVTASLPSATVGTPYSATLTGAGGTPPYRWSKVPHTKLPRGLKLTPTTGVISGTPKAAGTYVVSLRMKDKARPKHTATRNLTLVVN